MSVLPVVSLFQTQRPPSKRIHLFHSSTPPTYTDPLASANDAWQTGAENGLSILAGGNWCRGVIHDAL
jgi:hypothetical protein